MKSSRSDSDEGDNNGDFNAGRDGTCTGDGVSAASLLRLPLDSFSIRGGASGEIESEKLSPLVGGVPALLSSVEEPY